MVKCKYCGCEMVEDRMSAGNIYVCLNKKCHSVLFVRAANDSYTSYNNMYDKFKKDKLSISSMPVTLRWFKGFACEYVDDKEDKNEIDFNSDAKLENTEKQYYDELVSEYRLQLDSSKGEYNELLNKSKKEREKLQANFNKELDKIKKKYSELLGETKKTSSKVKRK